MQSIVPVMTPTPGERVRRFVGDSVRFELKDRDGLAPPKGWRALLRTNLGRAADLRREILQAHTAALKAAGGSWRDVPMDSDARGWSIELPLAEVGYFKAKAYAIDPQGWQHWPEGPDVGIPVHPDYYRTANILYCGFARMFGATKSLRDTRGEEFSPTFAALDNRGYTVIPPSGKLRDLTQHLPHIIDTLGCRILHLLPVHPTPTTYARFGRFGSPYAALDLTAIDPALVAFDKRTTGVDQFRELTYACHLRGARVFLDIVINHTGWSSVLQEQHPEWFLRNPDHTFASPGAWGVTWEDLVELNQQNLALWDQLSEMFLIWCRRGVDGFRCDAGYKVPVAAWQYIVARVQQEYPETIFFLEGLGGSWEATEALLTEGGMQWAYSELFQNYSGVEVAHYLDHFLKQDQRVGLLVHYSETHDNDRLAARGRAWSLLRNRLCALASANGGFGFTTGVEWLADEKIRVHGSAGMSWGNPENLVAELARLSRLLADHPCFFDGARLSRLSSLDSDGYALLRESALGEDQVLVLVNTDLEKPTQLSLQSFPPTLATMKSGYSTTTLIDLLGQPAPAFEQTPQGKLVLRLEPGAAYCLAPAPVPRGLHGEKYRQARAQAGWGFQAISALLPVESVGRIDWRALAAAVDRWPAGFLALVSRLEGQSVRTNFPVALAQLESPDEFSPVVTWTLLDARRVTPVPPRHWLLVQDSVRFRAALSLPGSDLVRNVESIPTASGQVACFPPCSTPGDATLSLERYTEKDPQVQARVRFLARAPAVVTPDARLSPDALRLTDLVLLTNGRGGMARLCIDLGRVLSKYDCVLGANLHPTLPVDRHILAKRLRVWVNADGFISPLDFRSLNAFETGPPAIWHFVAQAGDGRTVEIQMTAEMLPGRNTTVFHFSRPTAAQASGKQLPPQADVRLTVRVDIEDRNFHWETKRNSGADYHFSVHTKVLPAAPRPAPANASGVSDNQAGPQAQALSGFVFTPAADRILRVFADHGLYHSQPEWSENIPHPVERSRGQTGSGDAFSPGWFDLPLPKGATATLVLTADPSPPEPQELELARLRFDQAPPERGPHDGEGFRRQLLAAIRAFVVKRNGGKTVIAGYPWFLDWGRDTFICARGLLAVGMTEEVKQLLLTFGRFERDGTLPNTIFGDDASNRDTSDAPLWFGLVCEELGADLELLAPAPGRTLRAVLESIALNYQKGTPNGIRMDPASGLIWSPRHFTWMDTNYPACTPREGYPVEIQALWIRLLRQLASLSGSGKRASWESLAVQAQASLDTLFWREDKGYYADVLVAGPGRSAREAAVDDSLRSNCLLVVSLGLSRGQRAQRCVDAAQRYLVIPGGLRSLAPLPVSMPLPNVGGDGRLLNDPNAPYWGHYEGDEDTRRKPAYHNGTAWTWTFPVFCEALARAWEFAPDAVAAARAYLGSMDRLLSEGCLGQLPEILDGDAPHTARGCDAQAWGATEALRVWKLLQ